MNCPSCGSNLVDATVDNVEVEKCSNCKGILLEKGKLDALVDPQEHMTELTTVDHDPGIHSDEHPPRKCPHCDKIMKKVNLMDESSDIIYDYCEECKCFWLDNGEIEKTKKQLENKKDSGPYFMYLTRFLGRWPGVGDR